MSDETCSPNITITSIYDTHYICWVGELDISRGGTNNSSFTDGSVIFYNNDKLNENNNKFYWDTINNRLCIGTNTSISPVTIESSGGDNSGITIKSTDTYEYSSLDFLTDSGELKIGLYGEDNAESNKAFIYNSSTNPIGIFTNSLERLSILGNGNIGVNKPIPTHLFEVNGNIGLTSNSYINWGSTDGESGYGFRDFNGIMQFKQFGGDWIDIGSSDDTGSTINSWTWNVIDGFVYTTNLNDNVGIGVNDPTEKLTVNGNLLLFDGTSNSYITHELYGISINSNLDIYLEPQSEELSDGKIVIKKGYIEYSIESTGPKILFYSDKFGIDVSTDNLNIYGDNGVTIGNNIDKEFLSVDIANSSIINKGTYYNFGSNHGDTGYGFKDNSGTLQYKDSGGTWLDFGGISGFSGYSGF
ncbi:MAG: hypothetical protein WCX48_12075, partial [Bacteroidales bacterium]